MKQLICIAAFVFSGLILFAQEDRHGGGSYDFNITENCLSDIERSALRLELNSQVKRLKDQGILTAHPTRAIVSFAWPLQQAPGLNYYSYYGISNFVDQDNSSSLLDYNCSQRTYNGHKGTDIFTWPFAGYLQENDLVEVIAAAQGTIISKSDGNDDDHCSCFGSWNAVYVQQADGSIAWYGHLKENSLTTKTVGQIVNQGEYLGVVASSGCSTGPHLHFEIYDNNGDLIDPYAGNCNSLNLNSWWTMQPAFREPKINALLTHDAVPQHGCPGTNEEPHFADTLLLGTTFYVAFYYQDQLAGHSTQHRIKRPDGSIWSSWSSTSSATYNASWWWWSRTIPIMELAGSWTLEADYQGLTYVHQFQVLDPDCIGVSNNTWVGPLTGHWHQNAGNWSRGMIPKSCDNVIIPSGYFINVLNGYTAECNTITVSSSAEFHVQPNAILEVQYPN